MIELSGEALSDWAAYDGYAGGFSAALAQDLTRIMVEYMARGDDLLSAGAEAIYDVSGPRLVIEPEDWQAL